MFIRGALRRAILPALLLTLAPAARALEWDVMAGADLRWFDWREYQGSRQLLMERGPLVAPALRLEGREGEWFARVDSLWGGGPARYDGHLQSGPPYSADAEEEILEADWRLGWRRDAVELSLALLQRDWRRFINGSATVSSAEERYRWRLVTMGGAWRLPEHERWAVAVDLGWPIKSYQKVYSFQSDDFSLEPGSGLYWRLGVPWQSTLDPRLSVEGWYQEQYLDSSDAVPLTQNGESLNLFAYQPASVRRELGLTLRWRLGGSPPSAP